MKCHVKEGKKVKGYEVCLMLYFRGIAFSNNYKICLLVYLIFKRLRDGVILNTPPPPRFFPDKSRRNGDFFRNSSYFYFSTLDIWSYVTV